MINAVKKEAERRGITRLCHFTPSRNLAHILAGDVGVLATKALEEDEHSVLNPTDTRRLDGHEDYICCSIQYPNVWYFSKAMVKEKLFKDWVVLLIDPKYLWQSGTRFCPRNAAAGGGKYIQQGYEGFASLFAHNVKGAYSLSRTQMHLSSCPTDDQAEVLVPARIDIADILSVVVQTEKQARSELIRLKYGGCLSEAPPFVIAPKFFEKHALSQSIRMGKLVEETTLSRF